MTSLELIISESWSTIEIIVCVCVCVYKDHVLFLVGEGVDYLRFNKSHTSPWGNAITGFFPLFYYPFND